MPALFLTLILLGPAAEKPPAVPVAMVARLKGTVLLQRGNEKRPAGAADLLLPGDRLVPGKASEVVLVFLDDGHREKLKGAAVTVEAKGCAPKGDVERLDGVARPTTGQLKSLQLHTRSVQSRGGRAAVGELRGNTEETAVVTPMFGSRVLSNHPTLSWPAMAGAEGYRVEMLTGVEGKNERVLWRAETKETRLPYPEEEAVLEFGLKYRWRVTALLGKDAPKPVASSKFFVAGETQITELRKVRSLAGGTDPADWLLAAVVYEAAGVYDKALPLYQKLAEQSPKALNYQVALARYYERAGRKDLARTAQERAKKLQAPDGKDDR